MKDSTVKSQGGHTADQPSLLTGQGEGAGLREPSRHFLGLEVHLRTGKVTRKDLGMGKK